MYECLLALIYMYHVCAWSQPQWKESIHPLELELQVVRDTMWLLGIKSQSSVRATSGLNFWAISLPPNFYCLTNTGNQVQFYMWNDCHMAGSSLMLGKQRYIHMLWHLSSKHVAYWAQWHVTLCYHEAWRSLDQWCPLTLAEIFSLCFLLIFH